MNPAKTVIALLGLLLIPAMAQAQMRNQFTRYVKLAAGYTSSPLYYEASALPAGDGNALLATSFRIPNDLLVFTKNTRVEPGKEFVASIVVTVEVYRGQDKVDEEVWRGEHFASTYDQTLDRERDLQGNVSFVVPPGEYAYRLRVADDNSEREAMLPPRRIRIPEFTGLSAARAVLARGVESGEGGVDIDLVNLSGNAPFGRPAFAAVPLTVPPGVRAEDVAVSFQLRRLDEDDLEREGKERRRYMERLAREQRREEDGTPELRLPPEQLLEGGDQVDVPSGAVRLLPVGAAGPDDARPGQIRLPRPEGDARAYLAVLDLEGETLADGTYVLTTKAVVGGEEATSTTRFNTAWRNMPVALNDPDVAIETLLFLTDRATVRAMRKGSRSEKIERFRAFWKERDPSPETAYNELMAEYYRRIDHAAFEFRTGADPVPDGLKTDRARIYILQGPPRSIDRDFPPEGGVRETWTYDGGKRFVFQASSSVDEFKIVESD